ncbi:lysozyme inhibitor LprI family protein [Gluconobacter roseus]|uniref:lysozyme inhibitor LprI family protein n=1 Tax=Gluconobacter roseus TaxID=586239 RepID=UPI0038D173CB
MRIRHLPVCCVTALLLVQPALAAPVCSGKTTPEIQSCFNSRLTQAEAQLKRYTEAALRRMQGPGTAARTQADFHKAESAWWAFRDAECKAVSDRWSDVTIRTSMELSCRLKLTEERTYELWQNWLTSPDRATPILPEPAISPHN